MCFVIENNVLTKYTGEEAKVIIPDGVQEIGYEAFRNNDFIQSVYIPNGVEKICTCAFEECHNLSSVELPNTLKTIGQSAFKGCQNLSSVELPGSLRIIEQSAFEECPIKSMILPDSVEYYGWRNLKKFNNDSICEKIHFGKGLKTIGSIPYNYYNFYNIENLSDLGLFCDIKHKGNYAPPYERGDVLYSDFSIDSDNPYFVYEDGLLLSKDKTILYSCMKNYAEEIVIPKSVTKIMGHAFDSITCGCVVVPGGVQSMVGSFVYANIGTIRIEEGFTVLQEEALLKCRVEGIIFPKSLKMMEQHAFLDVEGLKRIKLYQGIEFTKYDLYESNTPFWFSPKSDFRDLQFVELYTRDDEFIARMGICDPGENKSVLMNTHRYLDLFLMNNGTVIKQYLSENCSYNFFKDYYSYLKKKDSKIRTLYGVLSMKEATLKIRKLFIPELKKYKKQLLAMTREMNDNETEALIESQLL